MTLNNGNVNGGNPPAPVGPDLDSLVKRLQSRQTAQAQLEALKPTAPSLGLSKSIGQSSGQFPQEPGSAPLNSDAAAGFTIVQRLERKFGLGDQPGTRRRLYQRLQNLVDQHGEAAFRVIAETVAESGHARKPDRWFVRSVKLRLQEAGMWLSSEVDW